MKLNNKTLADYFMSSTECPKNLDPKAKIRLKVLFEGFIINDKIDDTSE